MLKIFLIFKTEEKKTTFCVATPCNLTNWQPCLMFTPAAKSVNKNKQKQYLHHAETIPEEESCRFVLVF